MKSATSQSGKRKYVNVAHMIYDYKALKGGDLAK
jgi:hypothetical protein